MMLNSRLFLERWCEFCPFISTNTDTVGVDLSGDAVLIIIQKIGAKTLTTGLGFERGTVLAAWVGIFDDPV